VPPLLSKLKPHVVALTLGGGGGVLALGLGLPAAALIGSTLTVAVAAVTPISLAVHQRLRDLAFCVIGISLGAGVEAEALSQIGAWSVSLTMLLVCLWTTLMTGALLLKRLFGMDSDTAILATSPGTMSNAIALALEGRGDATTILILQMFRLLVLVSVVPPVAMLLDADGIFLPMASMGLLPLALLVSTALSLGLWGSRMGIPAACLLFGMLLSAGAHVAGLAQGPAPVWAVNASFIITGAALGARLTSIKLSKLMQLSGAGLLLVGSAVVVSLCFAGITHVFTGLPLAQIWIAFAPGGVEAMAAIGLALGYDPAYVAIHHFARILLLVILIPICLRRFDP
jgi:membrane AbrB-like protein